MEVSGIRWSVWALTVGVLFVAVSAIAWLGFGYFSGTQPVWLFPAGLLGSAVFFTLFSVVEGAPDALRRSAVVAAFTLTPILAFPPSDRLFGAGIAVAAIVLLELGAWRLSAFRKNLRQARFLLLARRILPFYFSAVSLVFAAALLTSPLSTKALVNPLPEDMVRRVLSVIDFAPTFVPPAGMPLDRTALNQLAEASGVALSGDEDFPALVSRIAAQKTRDLQQRFHELYRLGFFLTAFAIFKSLSFVFTWIVIVVGLPLAYFLERIGGITRVEEPAVRSTFRWN